MVKEIEKKRIGMEVSSFLTFKQSNVLKFKILDGAESNEQITDPKTGKPKMVKQLSLKVVDLNDGNREKSFRTISSRLREKLKKIDDEEGLIGTSLEIVKSGYGFETDYSVKKLS